MSKHFARTVRGVGPGLLLAHGSGGGVTANFGSIIDDLAGTHTVVGADYPGSGATPRAVEPLTLDGLADDLVAVAVDAGLSRFTVLGYSLGAAVAVRAATRYPNRVNGLVLTAGFAYPSSRLRLAVSVWHELLAGDRTVLARFLTLMAAGDRYLQRQTPAELADAIAALAEFIPPGSAEQVALVESVDIRAELPDLVVPTLVIATTLDVLTPPALSRELAENIPGARLVEVAAGHNVGTEAPGEWLAAIRAFLPTAAA